MVSNRFVLLITDERAYLSHYEPRKGGWARATVRDWAVEPLILPREADDIRPWAESLAAHIVDAYPQGLALRLVIPATWCFSRVIQSSQHKWRSEAATFAFEEFVPVALEELVCATKRVSAQAGIVSGAFANSIRCLIAVFEVAGVCVESITPDFDVMHGAADATSEVPLLDARRIVLAGSQDCVRAVVVPQADAALLEHHLAMLVCGSKFPSCQFRLLHEQPAEPSSLPGTYGVIDRESTIFELLDIAANACDPIDFRVGELTYAGRFEPVMRNARNLLIAGLAFLCLWGVKLHWHARSYESAQAELRPAIAEAYASVFPGAAVPPAAAMRLRSERVKMQGLTRSDSVGGETAALAALDLLHLFASNIPEGLKIDVNELVVDESGIRVGGRTTSHDAAGELVRSLNQSAKLEAEPPRTKSRNDKTVDFRVSAKRTAHDPT